MLRAVSAQYISVLLRLSPDIAGITLLAFASGAPDIFTELAAINGGASFLPSPGCTATSKAPFVEPSQQRDISFAGRGPAAV